MAPTHTLHATPLDALRAAVQSLGGQSATGRVLGVTQRAVWRWLNQNTVLPAEHVLTLEAATGISRHELRPDIYPLELTSGAPALASAGEPLPVGRTPACPSAGPDPEPADTTSHGETAGSGEAAGAMDCDPMALAADSPPIGKAAA